jgi:ElaB/YqjD/DUF883 family membrane-anchored ribosome-binding protein
MVAEKLRANASSVGEDAAGAVHDAADSLRASYARLQKDFDRIRKEIVSLSSSAGEDAQVRLSAGLDAMRKEMDDVASKISSQGGRTAAEAERMVKEHPFTTLLVTFGLGMIVAHLLRR